MKKQPFYKTLIALPARMMWVMGTLLLAVVIFSSGFKNSGSEMDVAEKDSIASVNAFMDVYKVLMSPRCMNCHPAGDQPLQGDDSHIHTMNIQRGIDGKGISALKCANCHQPENAEGLHAPPGNPNWHLPPANMKMVFEGKSARELALQLMNYNKNGHKNKAQLLEHANDGLVKAGWAMGPERTPPPLSYEAFKTAWTTWINTGAYAPKQ